MTTIAYKDGILAADTQVTYQGNKNFARTKKIFELEHCIFGGAGTIAAIQEFKKFLEGKDFNKEIFSKEVHRSDFIVIDKKTRQVTTYCEDLIAEPVDAEYFAIGSGCHYAYGALATGVSVIEAIKIASKFDFNTNNHISTIELK
jgi:20S proteasome alpha/beta subunit